MTESASPQAAALAPVPSIVTDTLDRLSLIPIIKSALGQIKKDEALTIEDQISLTEVEAPPFHEEARAEYFARQLKDLGLKNVRIDGIGNVIGVRPGSGNGPRLVLGAHLDTVFPKGTNVKVRRENGILYAPGISDDARGLAVLLEVLRTLNAFDIKTEGDLLFIATVGEEGNGDLRGSKHLFAAGEEHIDGFISVDGADIGVLLHGLHRLPPIPRHIQRPRRTQLEQFRYSECQPCARPRNRENRRPSGFRVAENDLLRRYYSGRKFNQCDPRKGCSWNSIPAQSTTMI